MTPLDRKLRAVLSRDERRRWRYRQRDLSQGVWLRVARTLADAAEAFVIDPADVGALLAEGVEPETSGVALEPPLRLFFVSPERLARLASRRAVEVRLSAEVLSLRALALIRFP